MFLLRFFVVLVGGFFFLYWKKKNAVHCISAFGSEKGRPLPPKGRMFQLFILVNEKWLLEWKYRRALGDASHITGHTYLVIFCKSNRH